MPATRVLSVFIIPFLLVAFVVLYFYPSAKDTARLFAWKIVPPFTPMVLGSVYLGGAYFFLRAARATEWHRVEGGFISVGLFASLMGIATIVHWNKFIHSNLAFWLWAGLYFTTPFLVFGVWLLNRREESEATPDDLVMSPATATLIGLLGAAAAASSVFLFLFPKTAIPIWPWKLTELTARVMGAIFALGFAGLGAFSDRRWTGARILLQVEGFMLALILVAAVRAHRDFNTSRPMTWLFAVGFIGLTVATAIFYARMEARAPHKEVQGPS
ncbi:MAG: hypothetical protein M3083_18805 [Actinomycetota bacterium]|nr:hypothetical protein [Actinomycetota bacterium]